MSEPIDITAAGARVDKTLTHDRIIVAIGQHNKTAVGETAGSLDQYATFG